MTSCSVVFLDIDICDGDSSVELSVEFVPGGEEFAAKLDLLGVTEEDEPVSSSRSGGGLSVVLKILISQHLVGALFVVVLVVDHWGAL